MVVSLEKCAPSLSSSKRVLSVASLPVLFLPCLDVTVTDNHRTTDNSLSTFHVPNGLEQQFNITHAVLHADRDASG